MTIKPHPAIADCRALHHVVYRGEQRGIVPNGVTESGRNE
jgi:hypothetical protein